MMEREGIELPVCPLSGGSCKGSRCAAAVALKREKRSRKVRWCCGLARAGRDEGRVVVDVTEEGR